MNAAQAFDAGKFLSQDKSSPDFAEFWLRHFRNYCEKFLDAQAETIPSFLKAYIIFTVKSLLGSKTLQDLPVFVEHLKTLQAINENLVPPLAAAVIELCKCAASDEAEASFTGLPISQQHHMFKSALYQQFSGQKLAKRCKMVMADHGAEPEARLALARNLLKHSLADE